MLYPDMDVFGHMDGDDERPGPWIGLTAYKATKVYNLLQYHMKVII